MSNTYDLVDPRFDNKPIFYTGMGGKTRLKDIRRNVSANKVIDAVFEAGFTWADIMHVRDRNIPTITAFYREALRYTELIEAGVELTNIQPCYIATWKERYNLYLVSKGKKKQSAQDLALIEADLDREAEEGSTPKKAVDLLWSMIPEKEYNFILDPCSGTGSLMNGRSGTLIEIDRQIFADAIKTDQRHNMQIINTDYLAWVNPIKQDLIPLNPPFNSVQPGSSKKISGSKFIMKALGELKEGGVLAFIMQSTWRGYKGMTHNIYSEMAKQGAFKSIYMIHGHETPKFFNGIAGGGIDLVIFIKGEKPGNVWVRNIAGEEYTYNQSEFMQNVPFYNPVEYGSDFDDINGIINRKGYNKYSASGASPLEIDTFYMTSKKRVNYTLKKDIEQNTPKTMYDSRVIKKNMVCFDMNGEARTSYDAGILPMVKEAKKEAFVKMISKQVSKGHTGGGFDIQLPPFARHWFTAESLKEWEAK